MEPVLSYREVESSKDVGVGMIQGGIFLFILFSSVQFYIADRNGTLDLILESSYTAGKFWGALALYSLFQILIILFCGLLFYRGTKEIKANGDWLISVEKDLITLQSPNVELQESYTLDLLNLLSIEKHIKDIGDGDESITWKFKLEKDEQLELKHFGSLSLDDLATHLNTSCGIKYIIRNFDIRNQEI